MAAVFLHEVSWASIIEYCEWVLLLLILIEEAPDGETNFDDSQQMTSSDAAAAADVDGLVIYDDMRVKLSSHSPRVPFYIDIIFIKTIIPNYICCLLFILNILDKFE